MWYVDIASIATDITDIIIDCYLVHLFYFKTGLDVFGTLKSAHAQKTTFDC